LASKNVFQGIKTSHLLANYRSEGSRFESRRAVMIDLFNGVKFLKYAIFGTGTMAKLWLQSEKDFKLDYFFTGMKEGGAEDYLGVPIVKPEEIEDKFNYTVLISVTTLDSQTYRNSQNLLFGNKLINYLKNIGFTAVYSLQDSSKEFFPNCLRQQDAICYLWTYDSNYKTAHEYDIESKDKLRILSENLFDTKSQNLLNQILRFRESLDYADYPNIETNEKQYLDPTFISNLGDINMLDLGAYNGDTAEDFINVIGNKVSKIYCIEPSNINLMELDSFLKSRNMYSQKIIPVMCAMGSESGLAKIQGSGSSLIVDILQKDVNLIKNGNIVPVCTVDQTFNNLGINLIKMDIEGAEKEVLLGGKKYIKEFSPFLAIAIYHKPTDLFEIPSIILDINPNYKFLLRLYSENLRELILYCIPANYK
jgi:FkbM family methyltransferase